MATEAGSQGLFWILWPGAVLSCREGPTGRVENEMFEGSMGAV